MFDKSFLNLCILQILVYLGIFLTIFGLFVNNYIMFGIGVGFLCIVIVIFCCSYCSSSIKVVPNTMPVTMPDTIVTMPDTIVTMPDTQVP